MLRAGTHPTPRAPLKHIFIMNVRALRGLNTSHISYAPVLARDPTGLLHRTAALSALAKPLICSARLPLALLAFPPFWLSFLISIYRLVKPGLLGLRRLTML